MKIIDWVNYGNVIRFYLGEDSLKNWYGDDWNDSPYDCNAGVVYEEFVRAYCDYYISPDYRVLEQSDYNDRFNCCKDDFKDGSMPILFIVKKDDNYDFCGFEYDKDLLRADYIFYMGQELQPCDKLIVRRGANNDITFTCNL